MNDFLHFCPSDGWFGDAMPLYANGVYHIYYTKLYGTSGKPMSWGHISTTDFLSYTEHADPFPAGEYGTPYNTGCVIFEHGKFIAFYAGYDKDGKFAMLKSESDDGITFGYPGTVCFSRPENLYRSDDTWRDPCVFFDEKSKMFHMVFCAKSPLKDIPDCYSGVIGHAVSHDLEKWECLSPLSIEGIATSAECPDLFFDNGRYILGYYWHETRFRSSDSIDGIWERGDVISPDHFDFMAGKRLSDEKRHILIGWLPRRNCDCMERIWGGNMLIPRELSFRDGKTPKTHFICEIDKMFPNEDLRLKPMNARVCGNGWDITEKGFCAHSEVGGTTLFFDTISDCTRIKFNLRMASDRGMTVLLLGAHSAYEDGNGMLDMGYDVIFDASEHMIRLREHYKWDQRNDIAVIPYEFSENRFTDIDIVYNGTIFEMVVDNKQTMVSRLLKSTHGGMAFTVCDTNAEIKDFKVYLP